MLPRFRADLKTTIAQEEDMTYIEVADPGSGVAFRFYDFEYALAQQLNGQPLDAVVSWAATTYAANVTPEALQSFIDKLAGLGFLQEAEPEIAPEIAPEEDSAPGSPLAMTGATVFPSESAMGDFYDDRAVPEVPSLSSVPLFAGPELVELNSSPWPARLLQGESVEASDEPPPRATAAAGPTIVEPAPRGAVGVRRDVREPPGALEETPIASIAHAIVSEMALEARGASENRGAADGATSGAPTPPFARPAVQASAKPTIAPTVVPTTMTAATALGEAPIASSWVKDVREEVEGKPKSNLLRPTAEDVATPMSGATSAAIQIPKRRFPALLAVVFIAMAISVAAWFMWPEAPAAPTSSSSSVPTVHVMAPQPTVFHRWFSTVGVVENGRDQTLGFASAGRIQEILAPGTTYSAGETIARLKGTAERELLVNRLRSRIAFFEQLRSSSAEAGNPAAVKDAEAKLGARNREFAAAQAELAKLEIRPVLSGSVAQVLVAPGALVAAHAPVLRLRAMGPRAVFALPDAELAQARALTFCRLETLSGDPAAGKSDVAGGGSGASAGPASPRAIDCNLPVTGPAPAPAAASPAKASAAAQPSVDEVEGKLAVDLQGSGAIAPGTRVRLASARYENVFPVPQAAVVNQEGGERVWVVSGAGHNAEMRAVEIASRDNGFALVSRGLRAGDSVIVDPPASLHSGGEISVAQ